jgi:hypothetical protein
LETSIPWTGSPCARVTPGCGSESACGATLPAQAHTTKDKRRTLALLSIDKRIIDWSGHGRRLPMSKAEGEKQHERLCVNRSTLTPPPAVVEMNPVAPGNATTRSASSEATSS